MAADRSAASRSRDRYVTNAERSPARAALGVSALAMPGLIAEIECTALMPED